MSWSGMSVSFESENCTTSEKLSRALFSSPQKAKSFQDSPSHRILRDMHEALNINESKN